MSLLDDVEQIHSHLKRAVKEQLLPKIQEAITKHDQSCGCCGPTDLKESADAVCDLVVEYILEENEQ